jgi:hypothetical protein
MPAARQINHSYQSVDLNKRDRDENKHNRIHRLPKRPHYYKQYVSIVDSILNDDNKQHGSMRTVVVTTELNLI